jgi:hypothetical protein
MPGSAELADLHRYRSTIVTPVSCSDTFPSLAMALVMPTRRRIGFARRRPVVDE